MSIETRFTDPFRNVRVECTECELRFTVLVDNHYIKINSYKERMLEWCSLCKRTREVKIVEDKGEGLND